MSNRMIVATMTDTDGHTITLNRVRSLVGMGVKWEIQMDGQKINLVEFKAEAEAKKAFADVVMQWAEDV